VNDFNLTAPVAFIIFNKPESTKRVFDLIKSVRPSKLFIIADGPRKIIPGENINCETVRKIAEEIDWQCEVFRNYSEENLGCKNRVVSGLDWLFENVEEAIIVEDDCLPDISFFRFCQELLVKYRDNEKVFSISGNKVLSDVNLDDSYYFSKFNHIWGWATWRRVWKKYDINILNQSTFSINDLLEKSLSEKSAIKYWNILAKEVDLGIIDAWSVQLQILQFLNNGLTIIPSKNLVVNLGFDSKSATNTKGSGGLYRKMKLESITFPLSHPSPIANNSFADKIETKTLHRMGFKEKIRRILLKFNIKI
jgi:hypothetical protein